MFFILYSYCEICQEEFVTNDRFAFKMDLTRMEEPMENPTLELIHQHASVRHYKMDAVAAPVIETIVAAAQHSSTSFNLQAYSVIAVTDEEKRIRFADLCGDQDHIRQAPLFLVWCADLSRSERFCQKRKLTQVSEYVENFLLAAVDASLAAQNAALAAESLGLGICYIGYIRNKPQEVIDLLELPKLVFPITGMTVGWPAVEPRKRPRLPLRALLHWEKYDTLGEEQALREYDLAMIATGIYKDRQLPIPGKDAETVIYGWRDHLARRLSRAERTDLRQVLEKQGFLLK
jgi:FMN reductase (NADPH)